MRKARTWLGRQAVALGGAFARAAVLLALVAQAGQAADADGQAPGTAIDGRAAKYVDQAVAEARAKAGALFWQRETSELDGSRGDIDDSVAALLLKLPAEQKGVLRNVLQKNDTPIAKALSKAKNDAQVKGARLADEWLKVRGELYRLQADLDRIKANQQWQGLLAWLLSHENRWYWLCGVVAMSSLILVASHERRHDLRRWLNGGRARALGVSKFLATASMVLGLITFSTFLFGDTVYHWLVRSTVSDGAGPAKKIEEEEKAQEERKDEAEKKRASAQADYKAALGRWKNKLSEKRLDPQDEAVADVVNRAQAEVESMAQLVEGLAVPPAVNARLHVDVGELEKLGEDLKKQQGAKENTERRERWIRGGLGLGLLGFVSFSGVLFGRGVRRRRAKIHDTCPLCLGQGTFESLAEGSAAYPGLEMVQCKNVVSEHPFTECDFTFAGMYRETIKLCFPTLGVPSSGKTHWLAMTYRQLNQGNYPDVVQFERIRSLGSEEFDQVIDGILNAKAGTMATQTPRVPHPLVFNFLDHDRLGVSNVLVNIFDYSGEVTAAERFRGTRERARALDGDGFFFFLDPTLPSEEQSEALAGVREDLRQIKGVRAGKQIHVPIALCVSKIDLMVNEPYADPYGAGVVEKFYRDLGELQWDLNLRTLEKRSKIMADLRDTVWPGWQIERQIDDLFGGRFMFFPLTPVGLEGAGEADLSRRTIAPVGILEPLMWLLHMNGYPVLT